jgi:hypothetical protein
MGWMRNNRDALVITVIGRLLVTVGGGVPAPPAAPQKAVAVKKTAPPRPPPPAPPQAAPPAPPAAFPPPAAPKPVTTSAGTVTPENTRVKLLDSRLTVGVGNASGQMISRLGLRAGGATCAFARLRPGEVVGVRVAAHGAIGVRVVAISAKGATLKAAAKRVPRGKETCLRGTS